MGKVEEKTPVLWSASSYLDKRTFLLTYLPVFQTLVHHRIRRKKHQKTIWHSPGKINCWSKNLVRLYWIEVKNHFVMGEHRNLLNGKRDPGRNQHLICINDITPLFSYWCANHSLCVKSLENYLPIALPRPVIYSVVNLKKDKKN